MVSVRDLAVMDQERIFADWGEPAVLEEVTTYYDPESGQLEESELSTDVVVIAGMREWERSDLTMATMGESRRTFLVRQQELHEGVVLPSARLRIGEWVYCVEGVHEAALANTLALVCIGNSMSGVAE